MFCFCEAQIWGRRSVKLKCSSSSSLLKLECLLLKKRRGWREKGKWWQVVHRGWGAVSWDRVSPSADTCLTRGPSLAQPCWGPVCACTLGGRYVGRWPVGSQYGSWEVPRFLDKTKVKPWTPASLPKRCGAPCEKGERSRPVRSAVAVAAGGQRCGALGGLLPLLSRLRGSGAALGPGAASSPLSRTVQTCGWHVCLHPSLREFFLVNRAPFSSLPPYHVPTGTTCLAAPDWYPFGRGAAIGLPAVSLCFLPDPATHLLAPRLSYTCTPWSVSWRTDCSAMAEVAASFDLSPCPEWNKMEVRKPWASCSLRASCPKEKFPAGLN